jgi:hypothetical protein
MASVNQISRYLGKNWERKPDGNVLISWEIW